MKKRILCILLALALALTLLPAGAFGAEPDTSGTDACSDPNPESDSLPDYYTIVASANPSEGGHVTMSGANTGDEGHYAPQAMVVLNAFPNDGWKFVSWTEGSEVVSTRSGFAFAADRDRILVANFVYGYYAQRYLLNVHDWELDTHYAAMDAPYSTFTDQGYSDILGNSNNFRLHKQGDTASADVSYALSLQTDTALLLYVTPKDGYTVIDFRDENGSFLDAVQSGGRYTVTIPNIPAHELGLMRKIMVTLKNAEQEIEEITIKLCPLSYVYSVLRMEEDDPTFGKACGAWDAVCALYRYYEAARYYNS